MTVEEIKFFTHSKKKMQITRCHQSICCLCKVSFLSFKYSSAGRTTSKWFFVPPQSKPASPRTLSVHGEGEEVRIYSRKLSRVRQEVVLDWGLVTFFLLAFISGRSSAKGDWAEFLVKERLNYSFFICSLVGLHKAGPSDELATAYISHDFSQTHSPTLHLNHRATFSPTVLEREKRIQAGWI